MKKLLFFGVLLFFSSFLLKGQSNLLENGPMLGYCTMHEVAIWAQSKTSAKVYAKYYSNSDSVFTTNVVMTDKEHGYTAHLIADHIEPGRKYFYDIYINDKKVDLGFQTFFKTKEIWKWHTDPPTFSFATGSGAYINEKRWDRPGRPYGGDYEIYNAIYQKHPDFMVWGGDNIYLRQNEWNSWTGFVHRYTHTRHTPEMKKLLAYTYNYAILDDHDMGPNDCDGSYAFKDMSINAYKCFWANPPQVSGLNSATTYFNWYDADFFLLDNRYYRDPDHLKGKNKTQLGKAQLKWLKMALVSSKATFKVIVIGGQFLTTAANFETYTDYGFDEERQDIIKFIQDQNIKNVIFITGDRHFTELSVLKQEGKPTIYDLTVSPFTSSPNTHALEETNKLLVDGTVVMVRNFAIVTFSGKRGDRKFKFSIYDKDGKLLWEKEFSQEHYNSKK